ncbi:aldo/keto reductase, partial [Streptococcus pneumoniae]|nr:aldo/keto reductase [Streptococcus pneumoniae]
MAAFEETISNLGVDVLDLYLIHAPWPWDEVGKDCTEGNIESWKAMEKLYKDGKVRAIGVSNFSEKDIQ